MLSSEELAKAARGEAFRRAVKSRAILQGRDTDDQIAAIAYGIRRAPWWMWPILAACLVYPRTWEILLYGNPALWALAALALGGVMAPLAAIKLTFAPFALLGIRRRSGWLAVGLALLLCIPFGSMWLDYLTVLRNADFGARGVFYTLEQVPLVAVPVVAAATRHTA